MSTELDDSQMHEATSIPMPQHDRQQRKQSNEDSKQATTQIGKLFKAFDKKTWKLIIYLCWVGVFFIGVACCVLSLTIKSLKENTSMWQWSLIITALLGGPILSRGLLHIILVFLNNEISLKINAIYYIVELVESAWCVLWFGIILLAWIWVSDKPKYLNLPQRQYEFDNAKHNLTSNVTNAMFDAEEVSIESFITTALISILVGSIFWLIKDLLTIMMKSSFHIRVFFDRIREVCRHHRAMKALTKAKGDLCLKPTGKYRRKDNNNNNNNDDNNDEYTTSCGLCKMMNVLKKLPVCGVKKEMGIDTRSLEEVCQETVSCWDVEVLMKEIRTTQFGYKSTNDAKETLFEDINSVKKDTQAATILFEAILPPDFQLESRSKMDHAVQKHKEKGEKSCYNQPKREEKGNEISITMEERPRIKLDDEELLKHLKGKQASQMLDWFGNAGFEYIDQEAVQKYVVWAFKYHGALVRGLRDNGALFRDLNRCVNLALVIAIIILWLIMANKVFRNVIIVIGSGIVACAFAFGKFCKMMLDNFAFVFLVHPFDAGDYCLIDGTSVIIEDVNLLTTVALTLNDQQIHFPNTVLVKKNIINYTRSSNMSDSVVFFLNRRTTEAQIKELKNEINRYIQGNPRIWDEVHNLVLEYDTLDSEKIKATLNIKHLYNYYDPTERKVRKSNFIEYLNTILPDNRDEENDKKSNKSLKYAKEFNNWNIY